jgi:hypothetical protein
MLMLINYFLVWVSSRPPQLTVYYYIITVIIILIFKSIGSKHGYLLSQRERIIYLNIVLCV